MLTLLYIFLILIYFILKLNSFFRVLAGSSKLHTAMFKSILGSPLSFFDTTPTGRILNRFSRDLDERKFIYFFYCNRGLEKDIIKEKAKFT